MGEAVLGSGEQVDLSRWGNYKGDSRSIFAWGSEMEFLAGYDYAKDAGTVHVAIAMLYRERSSSCGEIIRTATCGTRFCLIKTDITWS